LPNLVVWKVRWVLLEQHAGGIKVSIKDFCIIESLRVIESAQLNHFS